MLKMTPAQIAAHRVIDPKPMLSVIPLYHIAQIIADDWHKPHFGAVPYLEAMQTLATMSDSYCLDSARSIVAYFLANAQTWKGETARQVKKELNRRLKEAK